MKKLGRIEPDVAVAMRAYWLTLILGIVILASVAALAQEEAPAAESAIEADVVHVAVAAGRRPMEFVRALKADLPAAEWDALVAKYAPGDEEMLSRARDAYKQTALSGLDTTSIEAEVVKYRRKVPAGQGGTYVGRNAKGEKVWGGPDAEANTAEEGWVIVAAEKPELAYNGTRGDAEPPTVEEQKAAVDTILAQPDLEDWERARYEKVKAVVDSRAAAAKATEAAQAEADKSISEG